MKTWRRFFKVTIATVGFLTGFWILTACQPPSRPLPAEEILRNWALGTPQQRILADLERYNVVGEGRAGAVDLFQNRAVLSVPKGQLNRMTDFSTPAVDLRNAWLEITFENGVLASVSLSFNSNEAKLEALKKDVLPQVAGFKVIRPDLLWLSANGDRFVYFGSFAHGWRYRSSFVTPPHLRKASGVAP
ncbi:MAG: hypothetical protein HKM06_04005, partial [Spirochaetales bacterium]|nr:hypothetical protein [Spirochaetales bacterium]